MALVSALGKKLFHDLLALKGQVVTIALVVACGIASYVTMQSAWTSLHESKLSYYERYRFADGFAHLTRAPESLRSRLETLPGVSIAYTRLVEDVLLPLPDRTEPATGRIISLPGDRAPPLNDVYVRRGRLPEPGHESEVLVLETFATAHHLEPGSRFPAVINGSLKQLDVVGIALSPEYVFARADFSVVDDPGAFGVMWMDRRALAPAFRMEGAFNDVVLRLEHGVSQAAVLDEVDRLLRPYGCRSVVGRDKQLSSYVLENEMQQLESFATVVPLIFLGVAAFLLNVVLSRLVYLERSQIATLKAIGYSNRQVAFHYLRLVSVIVVLGALLGIGLGAWLGRGMTELYRELAFHFPSLDYKMDLRTALVGVLVSLASALTGALGAVLRVARMPPAEAMQPPSPTLYRRTFFEWVGLARLTGPVGHMIARELERHPFRTVLSAAGVAMATGILVVGRYSLDAADSMMDQLFRQAWREDVTLALSDAAPERAVREVARLPGVTQSEGIRMVAVRYRAHGHYRDSVLYGYPDRTGIRQVVDRKSRPVAIPEDGVLLTDKLAEILGVMPGDEIQVELREGDERTLRIAVTALASESFGISGYMRQSALTSALGEEPKVNLVLAKVETEKMDDLLLRTRDMPRVVSVGRNSSQIELFHEQMGTMYWVMAGILTAFAATIAIGVVYNNARVALSVRSRDLASLRVLGFTRGEIATILIAELSVQVGIGVALGMPVGKQLCIWMMTVTDPEQFRFPIEISPASYALAFLTTLLAAALSALLVKQRIDRLDLVGVLKTRE